MVAGTSDQKSALCIDGSHEGHVSKGVPLFCPAVGGPVIVHGVVAMLIPLAGRRHDANATILYCGDRSSFGSMKRTHPGYHVH